MSEGEVMTGQMRISTVQLLIVVVLSAVIGGMSFHGFAASHSSTSGSPSHGSTATARGVLSLNLSTTTATVGSNITATINEDSGTTPVNAVEADLTYPAAQLQFVSSDISNSAFGTTAQNTGANGRVTVALGSISPQSGAQKVAVVTFKVLAAGSASISFGANDAILRASDNSNILTFDKANKSLVTIAITN